MWTIFNNLYSFCPSFHKSKVEFFSSRPLYPFESYTDKNWLWHDWKKNFYDYVEDCDNHYSPRIVGKVETPIVYHFLLEDVCLGSCGLVENCREWKDSFDFHRLIFRTLFNDGFVTSFLFWGFLLLHF